MGENIRMQQISILHLIWIIPIILILLLGIFLCIWVQDSLLMKDYDLYDCIYNNAKWNNFNKNPEMIKKIQDECICFRENNYTNLLETNWECMK